MKSTDVRPNRNLLHMLTAKLWSNRSLCKRASVGAIITSYGGRQIFSYGYNGPAKNLSHDACRGTPTMCQCLHAEENAIIRLQTRAGRMNLYTTTFPCYMCAQRIIQVERISRVFFWENYRDSQESRALLGGADIDIIQVALESIAKLFD